MGVPELDENRSARRKPHKRLGYLDLIQRPQRSIERCSLVSGIGDSFSSKTLGFYPEIDRVMFRRFGKEGIKEIQRDAVEEARREVAEAYRHGWYDADEHWS